MSSPPLHERKATPHKRKALLLTAFWRRFWSMQKWRLIYTDPQSYF